MSTRENSKDLILSRAVQIASVQGLNGLTIGKLAENLGMSKGGICAHYSSKTELQLAVVERAAHIFTQAVVAPSYPQQPGLARLQAMSAAWFDYLKAGTFEGGCFFTNAVFELDNTQDDKVREAVNTQYNLLLILVKKYTKEAVEAAQFQPALDLDQFAFEYLGVQLASLVWRGLGKQSQGIKIAQKTMSQLFERSAL